MYEDSFLPRYVSIHAPTKGATMCSIVADNVLLVSIHAPTKGATVCDCPRADRLGVSIHAPTKGATFFRGAVEIADGFQSTHPQRVRQEQVVEVLAPRMFQSTHPQRVRPGGRIAEDHRHHVSIHAPTKGATRKAWSMSCNMPSFNPRTHKGCDLFSICTLIKILRVSIHAPTKGATIVR